MHNIKYFVFSPQGHDDPAISIAASRAGAVGIFDAEAHQIDGPVLQAVSRLTQYARNPFGVRVGPKLPRKTIKKLCSRFQDGLHWIILDPASALREAVPLGDYRKSGGRVVIELIEWSSAKIREYVELADGFIVKGHEAGGLVSEETTFILLQKALKGSDKPIYARGGIGLHTAAACLSAGAAGVVLDSQMLLLRESPLREMLAPLVSKVVGNETVAVGNPGDGVYFRLLERPGFAAAKSLRERALTVPFEKILAEAREKCGWTNTAAQLLPLGQDIAFAALWSRKYVTVAGVLAALEKSVRADLESARALQPLSAESGLAKSHNTHYPIVQGPMTRVSDTAGFAAAVAEAGGLPMLALALMKGSAVRELLEETTSLLLGKPWGVGILGFAPADLVQEQVAIIREFMPDYALIAGGRPEQALALEESGIRSYLHVPSPRLLTMFLERGARRFVFEGRECGGHIGPLTSFVLWESMVDTLLVELKNMKAPEDIHILFAGGIHDALSAAMVATLAAPLVQKGVKVGVLMGSAYLATREIVEQGAILDSFQNEVLQCAKTVGLETGTGHASRCSDTPFAREFIALKKSMLEEGKSADEIRDALEDLNLGRLRLASKGKERGGPDNAIMDVPLDRRLREGMYMLGQVSSMSSVVTSVSELHKSVIEGACAHLECLAIAKDTGTEKVAIEPVAPCDIAIVGIGAYLPKAGDVRAYWDNIVNRIDGITEIPAERWDWRIYFDDNRQADDKIYSRWGGFLDDMVFDPMRFGIPPKALRAVDPLQLMTLEVIRQALEDAGYGEREFDREKVSVILGASGGAGDVGAQYAVRAEMPRFTGELPEDAAERLPKWTEDSFAGILLNVAAGRAANRFDFGGLNFTVDAACASSLTAIYQAVVELEDGRSDMAIAGGIDTVQGPFGYLCFSRTQALSPRGKCRTFDTTADGIVISEGIAMVCMKRLADAERDGDRIYAVIKGVGGSSDGRAKSMTAPHPDGQIRALERAYRKAGYSPASVGLFEAHGTGTVAGDTAELETVIRLLERNQAQPKAHAIGSVKTLIGHTKATAGVAGLIKSSLALYHKTLPPHANVDLPNPRIADPQSPLYLLREAQPWIVRHGQPRRAGVSAFGFGGTNFHVTLEEYQGNFLQHESASPWNEWPTELFIWRAADRAALLEKLAPLAAALAAGAQPCLRDLSYTLASSLSGHGYCAALVAVSAEDLARQLDALLAYLRDEQRPLPPGISVAGQAPNSDDKVALLFAGQGSQYPNMLRQLAVAFPDIGEVLARADTLLTEQLERSVAPGTLLSRAIYPAGLYTPEDESAAMALLTRTEITQPALGVVEAGLWHLLRRLGLQPDMAAGHSYGEFVALYSAGVMSLDDLLRLSEARGRFIKESGNGRGLGTMASVSCDRARVEELARSYPDLVVANHNAPQQSILSGSPESIDAIVKELTTQGIEARRLQVGAAFHSSFVSAARDDLATFINGLELRSPAFPVYSNTTAAEHSNDVTTMRKTLAEHLGAPVEFVAEVEAMYDAGARIFVCVGPKNVQASLISQILNERPHRVVRMDDQEGGLKGFLKGLGLLLTTGIELNLAALYRGRDCRIIDLDNIAAATRRPQVTKHAWLLNGGAARPASESPRPPLTLEEVQQRKSRQVDGPHIATPHEQKLVPPIATSNHRHVDRNGGTMYSELNGSNQEAYTDTNAVSTIIDADYQEALMASYQVTMRQFLQVQENIMLAYLTGAPGKGLVSKISRPRSRNALAPVRPAAKIPLTAVAATAKLNGKYPSRPVQAPVNLPEPKVAAPEPLLQAAPAVAPPVTAIPAAQAFSSTNVTKMLLDIVEDRTGYPQDMLGLDLNMEADLGIDSIKRVEIVGTLVKGLPEQLLTEGAAIAEQLNRMKTLQSMIDFVVAQSA